jgi:hypothetical protein
MDQSLFLKRALWKSKQQYKPEDVKARLGWHHTLTGDKAIAIYGGKQNTSLIPIMFRDPPAF